MLRIRKEEAHARREMSEEDRIGTDPNPTFGSASTFGGRSGFGGFAAAAAAAEGDGSSFPDKKDGGEEEDKAVEEEEECKAEFQPLVHLEEVATSTGEEDEDVFFQVYVCKRALVETPWLGFEYIEALSHVEID